MVRSFLTALERGGAWSLACHQSATSLVHYQVLVTSLDVIFDCDYSYPHYGGVISTALGGGVATR